MSCEIKSPESSKLKHARVSCVCVCGVVVGNLNVDATRSGASIHNISASEQRLKAKTNSLLDRTEHAG